MLNFLKYYLFPIVLYAIVMYFNIKYVIDETSSFNYLLDDAYIHLSVAKNLVVNGFPSSDGFLPSNPSSSPLWTIILSISFMLFNESFVEYIPLILNMVFSVGSIILFVKILRSIKLTENIIFFNVIVLLFISFVPLASISMMGMEHSLQIFLSLLFVYFWFKDTCIWKLSITGLLLAATRYEMGVFIGTVLLSKIFIDYLRSKKIYYQEINKSIVILFISSLLIVSYGLIMKFYFHLDFLPDSVISKINADDRIYQVYLNIFKNDIGYNVKYLFFLTFTYISILLTSMIIFLNYKKFDDNILKISFFSSLMSIFHILFSGSAPMRYEAYLIPFLIIIMFSVFMKKNINAIYKIIISTIFILIVLTKIFFATITSLYGTVNIHDQQIQMKNFINKNNIGKVAINDLGIIAYKTNTQIVDLEGLGTHKIALMKKNKKLQNEDLMKIIQEDKVEWIMIFESWYKEGNLIPSSCNKIGKLILKKNFICGSDQVTFYYCGENINAAKKMFKEFEKSVDLNTNGRSYVEIN